jgi:NAD(P)-dependent dehydrogenase (short-subunit alcohol dehydrogenase family)
MSFIAIVSNNLCLNLSIMRVKIAVVTGTAKQFGIGRAIARSLVRSSDYKVVGVDSQDAEKLDQEDPAFSTNYIYHRCDVSSAEQVSKIWELAKTAFGGSGGGSGDHSSLELACVVNNAAIADPSMPVGDPNARSLHWKKVIDVNLTGTSPFLSCFPSPTTSI